MIHHHNSKIKKHCQKEQKMWRSLLTPLVLSSECPNSQYVMREFQEAKDNLRMAVKQMNSFVAEKIHSSPEEEESSAYMKLARDTLTKNLGSASFIGVASSVHKGTSITAASSTSSMAGGTPSVETYSTFT